jgi:proline iminopeptidase
MTGRAREIAALIASWALVVGALPLSLLAGVIVLVAGAILTQNGTVAFALAAIGVLAVSAALGWQGAQRSLPSKRAALVVAGLVTTVSLALAASMAWTLALSPMPATVPGGDGMEYWDLPTGSRIAYVHVPADQNVHPTPLILVHGGPGSPDRRAPELAADLAAAGFDVYAYHQLGAGLSSRLDDVEDYTVARHVADLEAIRSMLGAEQVNLVGASWGAQLIANYLAAHPDRVERAVVSSPAPIWSPAFTDANRLTESGRADQSTVVGRHVRFILPHVLVGIIGAGATSGLFPDDSVDGAFEAMVEDLDLAPGCPSLSDRETTIDDDPPGGKGFGYWVNLMTTRDMRTVDDPRPALRAVTTPVLIMRAECDYIAWDVTREYRARLPGSVLVAVDDAGHVVSTDQPALYRDLVVRFLRGEDLPLPSYDEASDPWGQ